MARTDNLRKQHAQILASAREINVMLDQPLNDTTVKIIRSLLSKMHGLVGLHLAIEDTSLYPNLLADTRPGIRTMAQAFMLEMGALTGTFDAHLKRWASGPGLLENQAAFVSQTRALFNALSKRIHRENTELYLAADNA